MKTQLNILLGGLGLFALQGCKAPQAEQSVQPNVIYVFPTNTVIRRWSSGARKVFARK